MDVAGLYFAVDVRAQQSGRQSGKIDIAPLQVRIQRGADAEIAVRQPRQLRSQRFYLGHLEQQAQVLALRVQGRGDGGSR